MKLVIAGTLENISTRVDGTVKITFGSQEIDNDSAGKLFSLRGKYCKFLLSDSEITEAEENLIDSEKIDASSNKKSPSQRLRSVLFLLWEQSGRTIEFKDYYKAEIERMIEGVKEKLDRNI